MLMMPLLMQGEQDLLAGDIGAGASYTSSQAAATAEIIFSVSTAGTWAISVGAGDALAGTPTSGTWLHGGSAGAYNVRFTLNNQVGAPNITQNDAPTFVAVSGTLSHAFQKNGALASGTLVVEFQKATGGRILTESIDLVTDGS